MRVAFEQTSPQDAGAHAADRTLTARAAKTRRIPRRVLMIAYFFPPLGGGGVQRTLKFVKYLPEFGWTPHVVTVKQSTFIKDPSLSTDLPAGVSVERVSGLDFHLMISRLNRIRGMWRVTSRLGKWLDFLLTPDRKIGWIWPAYRRALTMIRKHRIDALYTTSNPYSTSLVGYLLKRRTGIPWVADFRDEWTQHQYTEYPTRLHCRLNEKLERKVVSSADHVVSVSQPVLDTFKLNGVDPAKFSVITNGFDGHDIDRMRAQVTPQRNPHFQLCHTGRFYGPRTPKHFLAALESLLIHGHIKPEEIRVRLVGEAGDWTLDREPWRQVVEIPGYVQHLDSLAELQQSDCLLLFMPFARTYPGKVFEYIAMRKPILAMIPSGGPTAKLIRESRTGIIVPFNDAQAIASSLLTLFNEWKAGRLAVQPDDQVIRRFERRTLTGQLARILEQAAMKEKKPT